jgi:membrane protein required for colicin V production
MTWVDFVVLGVLAISGLLAFSRGFVREILGVGAWVGAAVFTWWALPLAKPQFAQWISSPDWVPVATGAALFLGSLLVLMLISSWIGRLARRSVLGGLDRTLGLVFGLARGALLVVFAYIGAGMVIPSDQWPDVVKHALAMPLAYKGAVWAVDRLPPDLRPHVAPPPGPKETTAEQLLHAQPQGRAVGPASHEPAPPPRQQTRN